ncbi:MAG: YqjD family protein [Acidobacteriota bacterium]
MDLQNPIEGTGGRIGGMKEGSERPYSFERVKETLAEKLHHAAESLRDKAESEEARPAMARRGMEASDWLDRTAEYIDEFDYEEASEKVQTYVRENPGYSLLMAGAFGLLLGAIIRRR